MNKKPLVLIVDDDKSFREIWKLKLQYADFDVLEAENGKVALEILKNHKPDIILLDIMMPEMDGIETFFAIKQNPELRDTKILFITSMDDLNAELGKYHKKLAGEIGAVDYLRKATGLNELVDTLKKIIETKKD